MKRNIIRNIENIYIHLPFCQKKCYYCSFPIHAIGKNQQDNEHFDAIQKTYLKNITDEIRLTNIGLFQNQRWQKQPLKSIYFGGGTPSLFQTEYIYEILKTIREAGFSIQKETEITMECDPGTFDANSIKQYEEMNINRISLGIQSFNDLILKNLNRPQNVETNFQAVDILKCSKQFNSLNNVSIDLIMNLPQMACSQEQKELTLTRKELDKIWEDDIQQAIKLSPGHLSIYSLAIEPGSYFYEKNNYREGEFPLPTDQRAADMFIKTHKLLESNYTHYEISSFRRNDINMPIHNPIYWEGNKDFLAFGMGASSLLNNKRFTRPKTITKYYEYINQLKANTNFLLENGEDESDLQSQIESLLMGRLRTLQGLDLNYIKTQFGDKIYNLIRGKIISLCNNTNLIHIDEKEYVKLSSPEGFLICDDIVADISYYLQNQLQKSQINQIS